MLQRRGRKRPSPTLIQCKENQLREDYARGWVQFIHLFFCFVDDKQWYSVTPCVISKCEVKMNLLEIILLFKKFDFLNYIGIYLRIHSNTKFT